MTFFDAHDWLNTEGPYAFIWDHLLMVFGLLAIGVIMALFFIRNNSIIYEKLGKC